MSKQNHGFTLIEILIALTILAIVGVLIAMALRSAVNTQQRLTQKAQQLTQLQTAVLIIERDLMQIINRPILDDASQIHPAIHLRQANHEIFFEFTRAGVINPFSLQNRSTMQRIQYHYDGRNLFRAFWKGLDRTKETPLETQTLLTNLKFFDIKLIKSQDKNHNPAIVNTDQLLPSAIELSFESDKLGRVSRFVKLIGEIPL
jgi:general secretion pathway protein J